MLRNQGWFTVVALTLISLIGCGKTEGPTQSGGSSDKSPQSTTNLDKSKGPDLSKLEPPAAACYEFLEAVRTGNDVKAAQMISTVAREKTAALNMSVTPPASDTAKFTVGKPKYINDDGAQVPSTWTDSDDDGQPRSDTPVWVLRREEAGWRVVGVATEIFPNEPPLVLNFEDPDDMVKQQQWFREEMRRRSEKENLQAKEPDNSDNSMRR